MWNKRLFVFVFIVGIGVLSCEKYEGTICGNVVYMNDGELEIAVDAIITKIKIDGETEMMIAKEKTDTNGYYVLNYLTKGSWKIIGRLEIDSVVYEAVSEVIVIDGASKKEQNMVLLPIK